MIICHIELLHGANSYTVAFPLELFPLYSGLKPYFLVNTTIPGYSPNVTCIPRCRRSTLKSNGGETLKHTREKTWALVGPFRKSCNPAWSDLVWPELSLELLFVDFSKAFIESLNGSCWTKPHLPTLWVKGQLMHWIGVSPLAPFPGWESRSSSPSVTRSRAVYAVPQGSLLGSLVFLMYVHDLPSLFQSLSYLCRRRQTVTHHLNFEWCLGSSGRPKETRGMEGKLKDACCFL